MTGEEFRSKAHWRHVNQAFERKARDRAFERARRQGPVVYRAYVAERLREFLRTRGVEQIPPGEPE